MSILDQPLLTEEELRAQFSENALTVLRRRYLRRNEKGEPAETISEMFRRVSHHVAQAEETMGGDPQDAEERFYRLLTTLRFIPNSPTFTGAGTPLGQLAACFVLPIKDDMGRIEGGIFQTLRDAALIQQTGGGNGFSFSRLRPKDALVKSSMGKATGPVGFLRVYDIAFGEIAQGGSRRGANMGVLRVDHPDIESFITSKTDENAITNFNISVGMLDAFMEAVEKDEMWPLRFPDVLHPKYRNFHGTLEEAKKAGIPLQTYREVRARDLFAKIVHQAWRNGEPGMLFLDTANRDNPVPHLGSYESTNPCGEQFLLPYESCCLGSINLARHLGQTKEGAPTVDWEKLAESIHLAVRFLDDVVEANGYVPAVPQLKKAAQRSRRIGLGIMGLADLLYHLRIPYGSEEGQELSAQLMEFIRYEAMLASIELAEQRGPFPAIKGSVYDPNNVTWQPPKWPDWLGGRPTHDWGRPPLQWEKVIEGIRKHGIRNAAQLTIAPTGTIATVAGAEGYGCEPVFALAYTRHVHEADRIIPLRYVSKAFTRALEEANLDEATKERIFEQVALTGSCQQVEEVPEELRRVFVVASDVPAEGHVRMQAALQVFVDASISKCVVGDTLIFTERGLLPIAALYQGEQPDSFRTFPAPLRVAGLDKVEEATEFYFGGEQQTLRLQTKLGLSLEATPNHPVRVVGENGAIIWKRMDELRRGDYLVVPYGYSSAFGGIYEFSKVHGKPYQPAERTAATQLSWPHKITRDLARLIGYLTADGQVGSNSIQLTHTDPTIIEDAEATLRRRFQAEPHRSGEPKFVLQVDGQELSRFFRTYLGMEDKAAQKHIPLIITTSGPFIAREFIRGLTLSGRVTAAGDIIPFITTSLPLAREAQVLMLALGIPTRLSSHASERKRGQAQKYTLTILPEFRERFLNSIGFAEKHKQDKAKALLPKPKQRRGHIVPKVKSLVIALIQAKLPHVRSRYAKSYLRSMLSDLRSPQRGEITIDRLRYLLDLCADLHDEAIYQQLAEIAEREAIYTPITTLEPGRATVYDLHVPESHTFISNGLVSHNTINFPSDATEDDVAQAFKLAWKLGCKGLTVYVAGSREHEVLETEATRKAKSGESATPKAETKEQPCTPPEMKPWEGPTIRPRPPRLVGRTYRMPTPVGAAFITVNSNGHDQPFEVFINVAKAGSETAAMAEAIGRLISLVLRLPSPMEPMDRLEEVMSQLRGIGGGRPLGFGHNRVLSLPDGVARALQTYLKEVEDDEEDENEEATPPFEAETIQPPLFPTGDLCPVCGQPTMVYTEGCRRCYSCGHSEC